MGRKNETSELNFEVMLEIKEKEPELYSVFANEINSLNARYKDDKGSEKYVMHDEMIQDIGETCTDSLEACENARKKHGIQDSVMSGDWQGDTTKIGKAMKPIVLPK